MVSSAPDVAGWSGRRPDPDAPGKPRHRSTSRAWAHWRALGARRYTLGIEEEVMLLDPMDHSLAQRGDWVIGRLSEQMNEHIAGETHAAVLELVTGVHGDVPAAAAELGALRDRLSLELRRLGAIAACAGMHPLLATEETKISGGARYQLVADSMRSLSRREPTMALHVHIGVPDQEDAVRVHNRLREALPVLLALAANSPFSGGQDTGFASTRTVVFGGFPRTGAPRAFDSYADYVATVAPLISSGAIPDPSFLWWDVRLQPGLGTVETRVLDAQTGVADSMSLVALIQSLAHLELEERPRQQWAAPEVLAENRFLAARDGLDARLIDPRTRELVPVRAFVRAMLDACRPHAAALGCARELERVAVLAVANGAERQRALVRVDGSLDSLLPALASEFGAMRPQSSPSMSASERSD